MAKLVYEWPDDSRKAFPISYSASGRPERRLVITADDFGADASVNEAVEVAHCRGVLTAASLMVAAPAAADAVTRARRMPGLGVGLHLVLVEGHPALAPDLIPDLVDGAGLFRTDMARAGAAMFFLPRVRRQLAMEIEAQFAAFAATGLALDHVNAHKHFHLHPTIAGMILKIGRTVRVEVGAPSDRTRSGAGQGRARRRGPRLDRGSRGRALRVVGSAPPASPFPTRYSACAGAGR